MLKLRKDLYDKMLKHCEDGLPTESCGLIAGTVDGDVKTVEKHLNCLDEKQQMIYRLLSEVLISIGEKKNPGRDYGRLKHILGNE